MPSIPNVKLIGANIPSLCFKPCYKWNAFNTASGDVIPEGMNKVLNLVINGMPSIHYEERSGYRTC